MSNTSGADTALRGIVMLGVLGAAGYATVKYTPALEIAERKFEEWQCSVPAPDYGGGDAPPYRPVAALPGGVPTDPLPFSNTAAVAPIGTPPAGTASIDHDTYSSPAAEGAYPDRQASYERAAGPNQPPLVPISPPAAADGQFSELDAQLARAGVVYSLLERGGQGGPRYRFRCQVAVAGATGDTRWFQAAGDNPLRLMREVLDQIKPSNNFYSLPPPPGGFSR